MKDESFSLTSDRNGVDHGRIQDGCLYIDSEIYETDDWPGSEMHYRLTKKDTDKLFHAVGTVEDFITAYQKGGMLWFRGIMNRLGLDPEENFY